MTGIYYDLASILAAAGCVVDESDVNAGWQTRARSSGGFPAAPLAVFWHHTASATSPDNDLAYMCRNADDAPIGNILLDRTGTFWPVAAGASNCAGKGGPAIFSRGTIPVDGGNTRGFQIEVANNGVGEAWPRAQIDAYFRGSNALNAHVGNRPDDVISHGGPDGWAPTRKIDPATAAAVQGPWVPRSATSSGTWNLDDIRDECWARTIPPAPTPEESDVEVVEIIVTGANARFLGYRVHQQTDAPRVFILWAEWVNGNDPQQLWRYDTYRAMKVPTHTMAADDMRGVGLIGPVPSGDSLRTWTRADFGNVMT